LLFVFDYITKITLFCGLSGSSALPFNPHHEVYSVLEVPAFEVGEEGFAGFFVHGVDLLEKASVKTLGHGERAESGEDLFSIHIFLSFDYITKITLFLQLSGSLALVGLPKIPGRLFRFLSLPLLPGGFIRKGDGV
jgi:hypothetical protein